VGGEETIVKALGLCLLRTLTGHANSVLSVAISPDGRMLASGTADYTIELWDCQT
jgi:WD40 repeat protein